MEKLILQLKELIKGTATTSVAARSSVKHDGSVFEITPDAVVEPQDSSDVKNIVKFITANKSSHPKLALTPRGAGTDMTGAAVGSSIILDTTKMSDIKSFSGRLVRASPGARLYDIHRMIGAHSLTIGSSPSSRDIATLGGMVANNSAGEMSYIHGPASNWVKSLKVVLADGKEYTVKPLTKPELDRKIAEQTYESKLYAHLFSILDRNYDIIQNARPFSTRNSSGYNLWDVWSKEDKRFDLTKLFVGSQGTLGVITEITIEAVKKSLHEASLIVEVPAIKSLDKALSIIKSHKPTSIEGFTGFGFMSSLRSNKALYKNLGVGEYTKQQIQLAKPLLSGGRSSSYITLFVSVGADTGAELNKIIAKLYVELTNEKLKVDVLLEDSSGSPLRRTRNSTLALIQDQIKTRHASPFVDDMAVHPSKIASFLPKLQKLLKKHKFPATIHGHFGDGIFHILPIDASNKFRQKSHLEALMRDVVNLVLSYEGTLSGEHGDGMIRGPWLRAQFNDEIYGIFKDVKELFDPMYIFNPHKKTDASWEYSMDHLKNSSKLK